MDRPRAPEVTRARFGREAQAGRKPQARAYDAMIAATALAHGLPVYTCNPDDFAGIDGLVVVPVPVPARSQRPIAKS